MLTRHITINGLTRSIIKPLIEFDPRGFSGNVLWLDAADNTTITKDGSNKVSAVADKSSEGNNASQGTGTAQPTYDSNGFNGKPTLIFNGSSDFLTISSDSSINNIFTGGGTVFAVINPTTASDLTFGRIIDKSQLLIFVSDESAGEGNLHLYQTFSSNAGQWYTSNTDLILGEGSIVEWSYNSSSVANDATPYINGIQKSVIEENTPIGSVTDDSASDLFIGNRLAGDRPFDGSISEIIIYNRSLSTPERSAVNSYLSNKWIITLT